MKNTLYILIVVILLVIAGLSIYKKDEVVSIPVEVKTDQVGTVGELGATSTSQITENKMHKITLETNKGTIVFETYDADAPKAVENFITLANKGYYDGIIFHRVIKDFMIQGGDPTGTGRGGPGYTFTDELDPNTPSAKEGYTRGTVAMANAGPNTNGSQFFIMHKDYPLPHSYTIFGKVISGIEVVDAIANTPTVPGDRPKEDIVINKATVSNVN
jgi:cyclophilin family peptidyl-prolyl cis-trans isomerase